ncbi:plantaricin C family lantibiotic [Paenibacillus kobensis]|uniref:plantaricin C family lantibiotic n=1 Tax=Paenibacillus kobensis TaxID=59841 RepID=UPI000FDA2B5D|nr:plantaricin C family lantibiotic [Paenibacillus kobensis]
MNKGWKNPYDRAHNAALPIENPIAELNADELLSVGGAATGAAEVRWAETILTSLACAAASYFIGNNGHVCTLTVECQKSCK